MNASYESMHDTDSRLKRWVVSILPDTEVRFQPPGGIVDKNVIGMYLLNICAAKASDTSIKAPLKIMLNYLVTAWSDDPFTEHSMITSLIFAALETKEFEIALEPVSAEVWQSLNVVPRPSCMIMVPLSTARKRLPGKLVEHPLVLKSGIKSRVSGQVVDNGKKPLPGVKVTIPALSLSTQTDSGGMFFFEVDPTPEDAESEDVPFELMYRNKQQSRRINRTVDQYGQSLFYIQLLEV